METLKTNVFPAINRDEHELVRSHTQLFKQTIDNPGDHDLKRRQTLWSFQHKNRGAIGKFKNGDSTVSISFDDTDTKKEEENKVKSNKRFSFPRLKQKVKETSTVSVSDDTIAVKREYSSALRIGNSLYEQLRIKQKLDNNSSTSKNNNALKSIRKFPEVASSLSKISYLKSTKNVVHYGGGFFGRSTQPERRVTDLRRSATMVSPTESRSFVAEKQLEKKPHHCSLRDVGNEGSTTKEKNLRSDPEKGDILTVCSQEISEKIFPEKSVKHSTHKRKSDKVNDNKPKKSKEELIEQEILSEKFSISFDKQCIDDIERNSKNGVDENEKKRNEAWQKDIDLKVAKRESENKQLKREPMTRHCKASQTQFSSCDDRSESDLSLDMPEDQFGPSSHKMDEGAMRQLSAAYGLNPYKWTSRSSLTEHDKTWVKKALEKTELIDSTAYDVFARKKSKSGSKGNNDHFGRERSQLLSKPP